MDVIVPLFHWIISINANLLNSEYLIELCWLIWCNYKQWNGEQRTICLNNRYLVGHSLVLFFNGRSNFCFAEQFNADEDEDED